MKKILILIITLNSFTNSVSQTVIVVNPNQPNYIGDALKQNADLQYKYQKLRSDNSEIRHQQEKENEKEIEKNQDILNEALSIFKLNFKQGNFAEAMIEIDKFIDSYPNDVGYYYRGQTRFQLNDYVGTIADCNKGIAIFGKNAWGYYLMRAKAKEKLNDFKGALADLDQSLSLNKNRDTFFFRGLLKIKLNKNGCSDLKNAEKLGHDDAYEMVKKYCN